MTSLTQTKPPQRYNAEELTSEISKIHSEDNSYLQNDTDLSFSKLEQELPQVLQQKVAKIKPALYFLFQTLPYIIFFFVTIILICCEQFLCYLSAPVHSTSLDKTELPIQFQENEQFPLLQALPAYFNKQADFVEIHNPQYFSNITINRMANQFPVSMLLNYTAFQNKNKESKTIIDGILFQQLNNMSQTLMLQIADPNRKRIKIQQPWFSYSYWKTKYLSMTIFDNMTDKSQLNFCKNTFKGREPFLSTQSNIPLWFINLDQAAHGRVNDKICCKNYQLIFNLPTHNFCFAPVVIREIYNYSLIQFKNIQSFEGQFFLDFVEADNYIELENVTHIKLNLPRIQNLVTMYFKNAFKYHLENLEGDVEIILEKPINCTCSPYNVTYNSQQFCKHDMYGIIDSENQNAILHYTQPIDYSKEFKIEILAQGNITVSYLKFHIDESQQTDIVIKNDNLRVRLNYKNLKDYKCEYICISSDVDQCSESYFQCNQIQALHNEALFKYQQ